MKNLVLSSLFFLIWFGTLNGQITLTSSQNSPKSNFRYLYDTVEFNYSLALPSGANITWDLSDLEVTGDSMSYYFTRNPNYLSFPGYEIHSYPDPADTSFLYSNLAIYRTSDTLYSKAYGLAKSYIGTYSVELFNTPILRFPFPFEYTMYEYSNSGVNIFAWESSGWKKSEAWGRLVLPDTVYPSTLRIQTYRYNFEDTGSHEGNGSRIQTFEWFDENSELCILSLTIIEYLTRYFSPPYTYFKDTIAILNTNRIYSPCTLGIESTTTEHNFLIYPNPASNYLTIETQNLRHVSITNLQGQELITQQITEATTLIDISKLPDGLYLIHLGNETNRYTEKFIKK